MRQLISSVSEEKYAHQLARKKSPYPQLWAILDEVTDPEIPVMTLWDMGILKDVVQGDDQVIVTITPTYSGCPAIEQIRDDIKTVLASRGYPKVSVKTQLAPAWTTEWMTSIGRNKLRQHGIAPPSDAPESYDQHVTPEANVKCPACASRNTKRVSEFGSTACKALFRCSSCHEVFYFFKNI